MCVTRCSAKTLAWKDGGEGGMKRRRRSEGDAQKRRVLGSWTSEGGKGRAPQRSKQVNQRHAAQNGRYPISPFPPFNAPYRLQIFVSFPTSVASKKTVCSSVVDRK